MRALSRNPKRLLHSAVAVAALASIGILGTSSSAQVPPGVGNYIRQIPILNAAGDVVARIQTSGAGEAATLTIVDPAGNQLYRSSPSANQGGQSLTPLAGSALTEKTDTADDIKKLRRDIDKLNANLNVVIARVNQLSAAK